MTLGSSLIYISLEDRKNNQVCFSQPVNRHSYLNREDYFLTK